MLRNAALSTLIALALSAATLGTSASALAAGPPTGPSVSAASDDLSGYSNVERIAGDDDSDPDATQALLDSWTPEAMESAVNMDVAPGVSGGDSSVTGAPIIGPQSWLAQPAPATPDATVDPGAPTGPVDADSADATPVDNPPDDAQSDDTDNSGDTAQDLTGRIAQPRSSSWPTNGLPTVGALFFNVGPIHQRCTGTVISTSTGNIIATAGHCIWNKLASWLPPVPMPNPVFVPGYHNGQAPYGKWTVKDRWIASSWRKNLHPDYDYGFMVLNKRNGRQIQDVVGANGWRTTAGYDNWVEITGYPDNRDNPLQCYTWTRQARNWLWQLVFPCDNYHEGVSGSLLMERFGQQAPGYGIAIASLGGYQQGGTSDNVSYAVRWNIHTAALLSAAVRGQ
ncbi:hypothetical protein F7Q99_33035 [Streptomyces kaniharaensis]|uniref:Trypsin-like serine protease n=1 Tax=Streptomyces kaniharaensis TaxID=212423 RepID=A0A6N7L178_9ACTN|nr:hypothetical protein [Streptomyces kaniharaensis]MQS16885.1 hypothetical protein [Streptomyces kaniharaensis]